MLVELCAIILLFNNLLIIQLGGLKVGDYIVEIGGHDSKYFTQAQILEKIRTSMNTLDLKIITPMLSYNSANKPVYITFLLCLQHSVRHHYYAISY